MSLLGRLNFPILTRALEDRGPGSPVADDVVVPAPRLSPDDGDVIHLLVHNDPDSRSPSYPSGWTLLAYGHDARRCWSESLAAHGAGLQVAPRIAKAVAVRVLADRGLAVTAWADHPRPELEVTYRAVVAARRR